MTEWVSLLAKISEEAFLSQTKLKPMRRTAIQPPFRFKLRTICTSVGGTDQCTLPYAGK
jgi:hypothetical protein